ncbi:hypothetical protein L1887_22183 [Cichorium endivia]|nr:hypothetical protein L1887_22183 [Cichorium endivia]
MSVFELHKVDSIISTHEHVDAVLGLGDIRAVQPFSPINDIEPTPIFLNQHAMDRKLKAEIVPLPVMHGEDYICLGFSFGKNSKVAYISDISRFIEDTELYISKKTGQQVDLLILDTLYKNGSHNTHFCFPQKVASGSAKRKRPNPLNELGDPSS